MLEVIQGNLVTWYWVFVEREEEREEEAEEEAEEETEEGRRGGGRRENFCFFCFSFFFFFFKKSKMVRQQHPGPREKKGEEGRGGKSYTFAVGEVIQGSVSHSLWPIGKARLARDLVRRRREEGGGYHSSAS